MNRIRFTLRTSLVVMTGIAIVMMFVSLHIRKLRQVGADVEALRDYSAIVEFAPERKVYLSRFAPNFSGYPSNVRKYYDTLDAESADDFVDIISQNSTISSVTLDGVPLSDDQAGRLLQLPLTSLMIGECSIGDTLDTEASITLEWLSFHRSRLNDRSLAALGPLSQLQFLDLTRTRVSDASVDYLAGLTALKALVIRRCKISEDGMKRLQALRPNLEIGWEPLRR